MSVRMYAVLPAILWLGVAGFLATPHPASAAVPSGTYYGLTSDLGSFELETDGLSVLRIVAAVPAITTANQCNASVQGLGIAVGGGSFTVGGGTTSSSGLRTDILHQGFIDQSGLASGTIKALPATGNTCVARSASWVAQLRPGTMPPKPGAAFTGTTDKGVPISFDVTADGAALTNLKFSVPGCRSNAATTARATLTDGRAALVSSATGAGTPDQRLTILISGEQAVGVYAFAEPAPSTCPAVVGSFTAKVGTGGPPPPATPAPPAGVDVVGAIPAAQSAGLLVTGGATGPSDLVARLGARGCSVASLAVLRAGAWGVYVNGAPAVVNSAFPSSLAASTPFYVRCD